MRTGLASDYGADHKIPVKVKYSGGNPWKIVVGYRDKEGDAQ